MNKRFISCLGVSALMFVASVINTNAWIKEGFVFCDANKDLKIDSGDVPVQGVLVVVTNTSGTFSNAALTDVNGFFSITLPNTPDSFIDFIAAETLPAGTTSVSPDFGSFTTSDAMQVIDNDFLIENPNCVPEEEKRCWLTGGGTFKSGKGQPIFSFGGNVNPGCSPTAGEGGNWNVIAHDLGLHFQGTSIQVIDCGNLPGVPPGSTSPTTPFNFIDFQGTGTITGVGGNNIGTVAVSFVARAEDLGEPGGGVDALYLRVFDASDATLILISATPESPTTISPLTISTGNLQLHTSSCPPTAPTLVSPTGGNVTSSTLRYTWAGGKKAAWYRLCIVKDNKIFSDGWYSWEDSVRSKQIGKFAVDLPGHSCGVYRWWVQGWNEQGLGPWSKMGTCTVPENKPGVVTGISPSGSQNGMTGLSFTWAVEPKAQWYELCVVKNGKIVCDQWYPATACASGTPGQCAVDLSGFKGGNYQWWVRAWNCDGLGPWSSGLSFTRK